jgi:2-desacetyl-2-hydroxyethyl bacteriochlorophyllide A dehydrogenase
MMRALVLTAPRQASVQDVPDPRPGPGQALVAVARVGVCGTDEELFDGTMAYFASGRARYPLRPGHEWTGTVEAVGTGVDPEWQGRRVTGDTMLADGTCDRCRSGRRHVCRNLAELGISRGVDGALADWLVVPADSLLALPDTVDDVAGALVEPGGNAWRAASAAWAEPGRRVLVWGSGTIGLLTAAFAHAAGAEVHVVARRPQAAALAMRMGADATWTPDAIPGDLPFLSIVDATDDPEVAARAAALVEPGGRVVTIGLAGSPSLVDTRAVTLKDVSLVGLLSGAPGLRPAIEAYASGAVDPRPVVAVTVRLDEVPSVLAGTFDGPRGPKTHIDPRVPARDDA